MISAPATPPVEGAYAGFPVSQGFDAHSSMEAFAAFPWVRACLDAISTDLTGLPLKIVRGAGDQAESVEVPEIRALINHPTSWQDREEWEGNLIRQLLLSGNAYALEVGGTPPSSLPLLHCESTTVIPAAFGGPSGYRYQPYSGGTVDYAADSVIHWRLAAWSNGPQGMLGEGLIRALQSDLNADFNAAKMSAKTARQGRPAAIFSPKDDAGALTVAQAKAINEAYAKITESGTASMVVPGGMNVEFPSFTPRDLEFAEQRKLTRETVLAAFGVPPTRVGLPTANYATAQQQSTNYWLGLVGLSRLIDAGLSRIARRFSPEYSIRHDFASVEALQEARTARLDRVQTWVDLGVDLAAAAAYEGFDDAPTPAPASTAAQAAPTRSTADWLSTRSMDDQNPDLGDSDYPCPPYEYAQALKEDYPDIWGCNPDKEPEDAFDQWTAYVTGSRSKKVLQWVKDREKWAALNNADCMPDDEQNPSIQSMIKMITCLKWGVVCDVGWDKMKLCVEALKSSIDNQPAENADRATQWAEWDRNFRAPAERDIGIAIRKALARQLAKVIDAVQDMNDDDPDVDKIRFIFPTSTRSIITASAKQAYTKHINVSYAKSMEDVGAERGDAPASLIESALKGLFQRVNTATADALYKIIVESAGMDKHDLAQKIAASKVFSASRSFPIAKIESTKILSETALSAWAGSGRKIKKLWILSNDAKENSSHVSLDGVIADLDGTFSIDGAGRAVGPGCFKQHQLDADCKCMIAPILEE